MRILRVLPLAIRMVALATLGIKAWYQPLNDITSSVGKIAGAAQAQDVPAVEAHFVPPIRAALAASYHQMSGNPNE